MTHARFFIPIILVVLSAALCQMSFAATAERQPNLITIFIDDMGWSDLSCFGGKTPTQHIDRLASEGIRFTQFYVNSPICSPSRVALTTGQYPQRWRITSYLNNRRSNKQRGMAQWLDPDAPVLARELKKAGYATGHFGKWHMGGQRDVTDAPLISAYGFDQSLTNFEGMGAKLLPLTMRPNPAGGPPIEGRIWDKAEILGAPVTWMQRSKITGGFVKAAIQFIDKAQNAEKPFFVNVWPDDVHTPLYPPLAQWGDGSKRQLYAGVLDAMDEQFAPLFDRIRNDPDLRDNTLILFCSDNGHEAGIGSADPLRGAKTWLYEGGIRSPLIVWGPGLIDNELAGSTNDDSIFSAIDLNRSLYTLAGITPPSQLDGEDLSPTLVGKTKQSRSAPIFWRRPPDRPGFGHGYLEDNPDLAARAGRWKYLVNLDGSDPQLYDLRADPAESRNLVAERAEAEHREVAARIDKALQTWNGQMPVDASEPSYTTREAPDDQFVNPIGEGADPWVVRDEKNDRYLWCLSEGNRAIAVHASDRLTSLGRKQIVWRAPKSGPVSREVWAPELHFLDDHWVIYFAASDGRNENHLAYALRSKSDDPLGEYELHGPLATGEGDEGRAPNIWAIDMTPIQLAGRRYAIWSGWDTPGSDRQFLYIAPMKSPVELSGPRVRICGNDDHPWEFTEGARKGRGLNEAPQVLQHAGRTFVTYSCGGSWLRTYKLGLLELVGDNPLDHAAWKKYPKPIFQSSNQTIGVGHSCFISSPDGSEPWHVFHAKRDAEPGWRRAIFVQPMKFSAQGMPLLGRPAPWAELLPRPAGEPAFTKHSVPYKPDLASGVGYSYYGHHQFCEVTSEGLHLGRVPAEPINAFRSAEKIVLDAQSPDDFSAAVTLDFGGSGKGRGAGLLFRVTGPSVGYDAHRGYFVGVKPSQNAVLLGKMDGHSWKELTRQPYPIDVHKLHRLKVTGIGPEFTVTLNGQRLFFHSDPSYRRGAVGLRVTDISVRFSDLEITQPSR